MGTGDSQRDSRESIRANHSQSKPPIFIARQADSHESLEFPIRENHPIRTNRANRFARITPLSYRHFCGKIHREGSCSKAAGVLSKVQVLNLVLGVGSFPFFQTVEPQGFKACLLACLAASKSSAAEIIECGAVKCALVRLAE